MITVEDILTATREHAVVFENRNLTCFDVRGTDGLDLLHRLSTNDILSGPSPRARRAILTTEKGRIVDLIHLVVSDKGTRMLASADARQKVIDWVNRFTITEDITLVDISDDFAVIYIVGIKYASALKKNLDVENVAPCFEVLHPEFGSICFWKEDFGAGSAGVLLLRRENTARFLVAVESGSVTKLDRFDEIETLRILAGEPAYDHELGESFNPLELGLRNAVSFTKGCYVGQEVIARLDTYQKVQRELVGLDLRGSTSAVNVGDDLVIDGESVGILTSICPLAFADGRRRGLAVVRRSTGLRSTAVLVRSRGGSVDGDIVPLLSLESRKEGEG
jgi:hypothetical protein